MEFESMSNEDINEKVSFYFEHLSHVFHTDGYGYIWNEDTSEEWDGCNNPSDAWPIIFENGICINAMAGGDFTLWYVNDKFHSNVDDAIYDENPLRAAMICFLKTKEFT